MTEQTSEQGERVLALLKIAYTLLVLWIVWTTSVPEHRRQYLRLAVLHRARVVSQRVAQGIGRSAMRAELAGQGQRYGLPLTLAGVTELLMAAYDRSRGTL